MTTTNRLDIMSGLFSYQETVGSTEHGALVAEYRTFSVITNPGRWEEWLERGEPFQVEGRDANGWRVGYFTARQDRIKNKQARFWYAYQKRGGKLRKLYLGRSSGLTLDRLHATVERFTSVSDDSSCQDTTSLIISD